MTQEKMRRIITACVSAATVLLVVLFGYLMFQYITMKVRDDKFERLKAEIIALEQEIALLEEEEGSYDLAYLKYQLMKLEEEKNLIQGK